MKVLVVDEEIPYPLNTGKRLRTFNLLQRLQKKIGRFLVQVKEKRLLVPEVPEDRRARDLRRARYRNGETTNRCRMRISRWAIAHGS